MTAVHLEAGDGARRAFPIGGRMGELVRAHDWSATPLGPAATWPPSLRSLAATVLAAPLPMLLLWGEERIQIYNDGFMPLLRQRHPRALGEPARTTWGDVWPMFEPVMERIHAGGTILDHAEHAGLRRALGVRDARAPGLVSCGPALDDAGNTAGVLITVADIDSFSDARYRLLFRSNPQPMWVFDLETLRFLAVNDAAVRHYGYTAEEFLGMTILDVRPDEEVPRLLEELKIRGGVQELPKVWRHRRRDGSIIDVEISSHTVMFDGRPASLVLAHDVTEERAALAELRESEARYRRFFEDDLTGDFIGRADGVILACNQSFAGMFGFADAAAATGTNAAALFPEGATFASLLGQLSERGKLRLVELTLQRVDGTPVHVICNLVGSYDEAGSLLELRGYLFDITERKVLEHRLAQAQKMEVVGRLAGGIAHDFNNLLTVIRGNAHAIRNDGDDTAEYVAEIDHAATRAAELTHRLLAFSRQQVLSPRVIDLNVTIGDMHRMLQRVLGETVRLHLDLADELWPVRVDPGQLQQVLMNLAVNARDAMPGGGTLVIATRRHSVRTVADEARVSGESPLSPGAYVELVVSDTGQGMARDVRERIFEPFFTTKDRGRGTGLGLATVYGIVTQSGGQVRVESEPGMGSSFRVLLPRVAAEEAAGAASAGASSEQTGGTETVLVVEDEKAVRSVVALALRSRGYHVLEASDGPEALALCESYHGTIDLLVTDVIMPEMGGAELQQRLSAMRPHMHVLFMSGYTADAIDSEGIRARGMAFLQKPFTPGDLLTLVRAVIDGRGPDV
jgi:two-component system, cell cycle sensor histidine kinase and response regulator CckA